MAVTFRTSSAGGGTTSTGNRTATIAALAGDLLVVFVQWSANSATNPTCTDNGTGTNTYSLIGTARNNSSGDICALFIRNVAVAANATLTIAPVVGSGTNTAGEIVILAFSGATNFGASAIRSVSGTPQFGKQENQTTGVPTPVLPAAARTTNPTIMSCGSSTTAGSVPNASWTERQDASQTSPVTSMEASTRDSGFTGTSAAYVSVASNVWNSMIIELDSGVNITVTPTGNLLTSSTTAPTVTGDAQVSPTGPSASAAVGSVTVDTFVDVTVSLTGTALTAATTAPTLTGDANLTLPSVQASTDTTAPTIAADASLTLTGQPAASDLGSVTVTGDATLTPTGSDTTSAVGTVTVTTGSGSGDVAVDLTGNPLASDVGTVTATADIDITLDGQSLASSVGSVTATPYLEVPVTGLPLAANTGLPSVTSDVNIALGGFGLASDLGRVRVNPPTDSGGSGTLHMGHGGLLI